MTDFEVGLINALERMGNTDWIGIALNIIGTLIVSAVSALVAFKMAKDQTEKQITKQNSLEVKKEKRMLATQIRLDKYEDLYESLSDYVRLVNQSYLNIFDHTHSDKYSEKKTLEQIREREEELQLEIGPKSRKIEILSAYHPEIRKEWFLLSVRYTEIADIIYDGFTYPGRFEPLAEDFSFQDLKEKRRLFDLQSHKILFMLTDAIITIINDLESDL